MARSFTSVTRLLAIALFAVLPLVSAMYAGWTLAGLPFVPFELFDAIVQILPGPLVAKGIEIMSSMSQALSPGHVSETAKALEMSLAILSFLLAGTIAGALLLALDERVNLRYAVALTIGGLSGALFLLVVRRSGTAQTSAAFSGPAWVVGLQGLWAVALMWMGRWSRVPVASPTSHAPKIGDSAVGRRRLVRLGGVSVGLTVLGRLAGRLGVEERAVPAESERPPWSSLHALPNAGAVPVPVPGTRPELTPLEEHYRIDIDTIAPRIREQDWRLEIRGLVERPRRFTLAEIQENYQPVDQFITLSCISNPVGGGLIGTTRWTGARFRDVLSDVGLRPGSTHVRITSADGFFEVVPLEAIFADGRIVLAYAWDGLPLARVHGFPLRIYIPDVYGMKQPKWIESIEVTDHWERGYWVRRGWDATARMKATSVIDRIAAPSGSFAGGSVPIGGFAHAGARGISRVELRIDGGDWRPARLRPPLSGLTWVLWRYDWPGEAGSHRFTVRCFDGAGVPQITRNAPPEPSGASGLHSRVIRL